LGETYADYFVAAWRTDRPHRRLVAVACYLNLPTATFDPLTAERNADGNDEDCGTGIAQKNKQNACQRHETLQEIHAAGG
jgi:hypothetical protein